MGTTQYLIDSNAVIDYLGNKLPFSGMMFMDGVIDDIPIVSVITKIEILGFNAPDEHYALLTDFMNDATVLDLTADIVAKTIALREWSISKPPSRHTNGFAIPKPLYTLPGKSLLIIRKTPRFVSNNSCDNASF
ncbi:hypothetical protein [Methylocucumis oryzae]|uniref:hypothetical protein n=1 Tax=Methylocucumis oryzae TaxID=1632867 RepID=UPI0006975043|nr:hypothetical protein [Methylocucumis oryzae]